MAGTIRTQFRLDADAVEIVARRAQSENRRGAWISAAIREYDQMLSIADGDDQPCGTMEYVATTVARLEQRLIRMESKL